MSTAIKYFVLGFRNAFTPIQVKMTKSLGQISSEIFEKNLHGVILIEFWFDQREIAEKFLEKYNDWQVQFFADYSGIERFAEIRF